MTQLFSKDTDLNLPDSEIVYYNPFLTKGEADHYFEKLRERISWRQDDIRVYGKVYAQPRLTALYADNDRPYRYSGIEMRPIKFTEELLEIKEKIELKTNTRFTSCLLNLYRNGRDSNGWHADNEKELGKNPIIASVSLGQERFFHLKHRTKKHLRKKIALAHGSLLIMGGATQHHYLHQIAKSAKPMAERINLTFRVIK
ncbi:alpha-ketoglutarate-dependent dioxygenase AlkB family protein [Pareuzebyella sediminis]|uniref:alpha-ketoglutarate-dependent dioxygenase AlkB family protein n=1 Tax=Pareuzebyella sediminis TaxID=2607998 RepID=UPI0011F04D17|nr:alpha-ketoglutarate-dependent dioxygenase AlkB [Pareuzebyella sediminis]